MASLGDKPFDEANRADANKFLDDTPDCGETFPLTNSARLPATIRLG